MSSDRQVSAFWGSVDLAAEALGGEALLGVNGDTYLLAEHLELVHRRGAVDVSCNQHGLALVCHQVLGQLAGGGGLSGTLKTHQHNDGEGATVDNRSLFHRPHELLEFVLADENEMLPRRRLQFFAALFSLNLHDLPNGPLLHPIEEGAHHPQLHVRLQQRHANLANRLIDVLLGQGGLAREGGFGVFEAFRDDLKH